MSTSGSYDDPPHVRDDYREVWRSGYRAGMDAQRARVKALEQELRLLHASWAPFAELTALRAERDALTARLARVSGALKALRIDANRAEYRLLQERATVEALTWALRELEAKWRSEGARKDAFHATMGVGWKACADELSALLASEGRDEGKRAGHE